MDSNKLQVIKLRRTTLSDGVYESLHKAIITLRLEPGQMVYETELAKSLGVSRTPVREAFRLLLSEDLIEILPQKGARIAYISRKKVEEARFVRTSLETSGFRAAAKIWKSSKPRFMEAEARLGSLLAQQRAYSANDDYEEFLNADESFHRCILEQVDNGTLLSVISSMRAHLNRMRFLLLKESHDSQAIVEQHEQILKAVAANREGETAKLLKHHIEYLQYDFPYLLTTYKEFFRD